MAAALAACEREEPTPPAPPVQATVSVWADTEVPTRGSMNGFIHSLSDIQPADALVAPLAPRLWRSDLARAPLDRATRLGARYQLVLSDLWGYPHEGWRGRGPPWANLAGWRRFVRRTARAHRGKPVMWDVWNEPNVKEFWVGGRTRFLRTYAVAARALRAEIGPRVAIGGPSISRYSPDYLRAFLESCVTARCPASFLSWHENPQPDEPIAAAAGRLVQARKELLGDRRYARLGLREIHVNEYVGQADRYRPGEAVAYLAALERGGADLAAHSCWTEPDCSPAGLDGLLDAASAKPRAIWWVHRWYAEGAAGRVRSEPGDPSLAALARAIPGRVEVLLGNAPERGPGARAPRAIRMGLRLRDLGAVLGRSGRARITVERVPASGERALPRPERLRESTVTLDGGALRLLLPPLRPHEAMRVTLVRHSPAA